VVRETMNWWEEKIRRYEHRRWTTDDNRRVRPFDWGLEHLGGRPEEPDPQDFLLNYADRAVLNSREWYEADSASDYQLGAENVLTFTSSLGFPLAGKQHGVRATVPG